MMKFLFYSSFLLLACSCFPRKIQAVEIQFNTFNINHQLSLTSTCDRTSKPGLTNRLEVVHRQGPCSSADDDEWDSKQAAGLNISSLADILARDQLRVNSIQARARTNKQPKLPVSQGSGDYIVNIGFGTPVRRLSLIFDTGSDVTWIQCQPCLKHCYPQKEPIFDPSASTTYSNISCNSPECSELKKSERVSGCYHNSTCVYGVLYGDGSYTIGFYSSDTLTVTPTGDRVPDFLFGCGQNNTGMFGEIAGILGLGRTPISFVSQTAKKFHKHFSYCLPSSESSTGFLTFGKQQQQHNNNNKMVFTPLVPIPRSGYPYYYIEITAIRVGGTRLPINESVFKTKEGTIIDSGTTITRLPPAAYKVMSTEFKTQMMKLKYKIAPPFIDDMLDTCFHISNITRVPTMSFTFKGNATLDLDPSGILYFINSTLACLAFAENTDPTDVAIFGNTQQMKFEWMYDVAGNQLGFSPNPYCL